MKSPFHSLSVHQVKHKTNMAIFVDITLFVTIIKEIPESYLNM